MACPIVPSWKKRHVASKPRSRSTLAAAIDAHEMCLVCPLIPSSNSVYVLHFGCSIVCRTSASANSSFLSSMQLYFLVTVKLTRRSGFTAILGVPRTRWRVGYSGFSGFRCDWLNSFMYPRNTRFRRNTRHAGQRLIGQSANDFDSNWHLG